tara:strand:+ start:7182 stop:9260 length:2079 start_codon:yes stop_codon:yes gene_type:complete
MKFTNIITGTNKIITMKKIITLQSLSLLNFKGIKSLSIDFNDQTNIFGANGTGKTTISDAFTWLLFGKDSTDRKDFEIKTLDSSGNIIPKIEHEVSASLLIDNDVVTLRRILKENWVKKRGSETSEFAGNVTDLYWNDVPLNVTEFTKKVNEVLNEQVFKMITSPIYFNSIKWQDRRNLLIDIFGEVSNEDIAKGNPAYEALVAKLTQGKTIEDYNAQIKASVKKAKEDLNVIPTRIDEVERSKPEPQDFKVLEIELKGYEIQLETVDTELADLNKAFDSKLASQRTVKLKVSELQSSIEVIESKAKKEASEQLKPDTSELDNLQKQKTEKEAELQSYENAVQTLSDKHSALIQSKTSLETKIEAKRKEWADTNSKELTFDDNDFHCPTCKREFESGDVETKKREALENFKKDKNSKLQEINQQGAALGQEKTNLEKEIETLAARITTGNSSIKVAKETVLELETKIKSFSNPSQNTEAKSEEEVFKSILDANNTYQELLLELEATKKEIEETPSVNNEELVAKRKGIIAEIDSIKSKLQSKTQIDNCNTRIIQLQDEERKLAQQIANVEKEQFTIENFIKAKVDALENVVNSKFKYVKFKMFDLQINGGLKETCEAMVNGVPYSDVNTASKINAGLDIINVLSEFYGITAPIFIDNAESVHTLIETESQLIRLVVSEQHKKLLVEARELVA